MQTYPTGYAESHHITEQIFREILPRHGMAVRKEQIALCHEVLDTLYNKRNFPVRSRRRHRQNAGLPRGLYPLADASPRTDETAHRYLHLQRRFAGRNSSLEYLPDLSAVLLDEGIITAPVTAVVRKGKERFVCDARLAERASLVHPKRTREKSSLRIAENILDMDHIPELSHYDRCRISVPQSCPRDCFYALGLPLPAISAGFHETRHPNLQSQLSAGRRIAPT